VESERIVSADVIAQVRAVAIEVGTERLSPIKERLPEPITYDEIRCVVAGLSQETELSQAESAQSSRYLSRTGPQHNRVAEAQARDEALFELLRQWRAAQAREQGVPAFVIFNDRVLRSIAANLPTDPETLRAIPGVGSAKIEQYGHAVLAIVQAYLADTAQADLVRVAAPQRETASSPSSQEPTDIILAAVADLEGLLSRSGLAKMLTGSPSERVAPYRDHPLYGTLHNDRGRKELTAEVDRLITEGYLIDRRGRLVLSPTGQAHLQETNPVPPEQPPS
jgi:ribonuclease D